PMMKYVTTCTAAVFNTMGAKDIRVNGFSFHVVSRQTENESQDQGTEIKRLAVMEDDGEPVAAVPPGGECHQPTEDDIAGNGPRHVEMIEPEGDTVRKPVPFPEDAIHPG